VRVMVNALSRAGAEDPAQIRDALAATEDFPTATGVISFNELGEIQKGIQVQIVEDGAYHHYATFDDPDLLAPPSK